jgi:hypothetical protein
MQEESRWRYALAQQIASHAHAHPKVAAVLVEGSVARGYADRFSDIDLAVFWAEPPTAQERRDIVTRAGGSYRHPWPSHREAAGWSERNEREGVPIDVRHTTVQATEDLLATVLEHADPRLAKQEPLAALRSALPLVNPMLITRWQQQAAAYPHALAVAMVRAHLRFRPEWRAGTAGRAPRGAGALRLLVKRSKAAPARPAGTGPPLLSWLAVAGSTDGRVAGDATSAFLAPQTTLRHRQHRPAGRGLPAPRPH